MVGLATVSGLAMEPYWGVAPVVLLYLLPVLASAVVLGLWPAVIASIAATLLFNFFFTAPYRTLLIHSPADLLTVVIFFVVAIVTSRLAGGMREQAALAKAHAARNATIAGLAKKLLSSSNDEEILEVAVHDLARLFSCNVVVVVPNGAHRQIATHPAGLQLVPGDLAAADVSLRFGRESGRGVRNAELTD